MATNADFFQVFGHITIFYATWDLFTTILIARLVKPEYDVPDQNSTLGAKLHFLEMLKKDRVVNADLLAKIQAELPESQEVSRQRNRFIHDQWVFEPEAVAQGRIKRRALRIEKGWGVRLTALDPIEFHISQLYSFLRVIGEQQKKFANYMSELPEITVPKESSHRDNGYEYSGPQISDQAIS